MQDLSASAKGSTTFGSMSGSNMVSAKPPFQPPGSESESVLPSDIRPDCDPVPAVSPDNTAGMGDRGGLVRGEPGGSATGSWASVNGHSSPGWTGQTAPVEDAGH